MNAKVSPSSKVMSSVKWLVVFVLIALAIGGNYYYSEQHLILRVVGVLLLLGVALLVALTTEKGRSISRLRKEAWTEIRKVVWPTRQETLQTTLIVVVFVAVAALAFWLVDMLLGWGVSFIIG